MIRFHRKSAGWTALKRRGNTGRKYRTGVHVSLYYAVWTDNSRYHGAAVRRATAKRGISPKLLKRGG